MRPSRPQTHNATADTPSRRTQGSIFRTEGSSSRSRVNCNMHEWRLLETSSGETSRPKDTRSATQECCDSCDRQAQGPSRVDTYLMKAVPSLLFQDFALFFIPDNRSPRLAEFQVASICPTVHTRGQAPLHSVFTSVSCSTASIIVEVICTLSTLGKGVVPIETLCSC
jgi:hypothetical protein